MTKENGIPQMTGERQFVTDRLAAYVEERKADDDPISLHVLSEAVGINRRYLQAILLSFVISLVGGQKLLIFEFINDIPNPPVVVHR